jgi:hypothetical protein
MSLLSHFPPVTILTELHIRLPVNSRRPFQTADRALPDHCRHQLAPEYIDRPGQRDRSLLLRLHRRFVARAAHPPGVLLVLGPGPPLSGCIENFWDAGDALETFPIYLHKKPELEAAALKRLGPSLFKIGNKDLSDLLVPVYPNAREYVLHKLKRWESEPRDYSSKK